MSGHPDTGVGPIPGLAIIGYRGAGSCRRGKALPGCRVTGRPEREAGCGQRATGSESTQYSPTFLKVGTRDNPAEPVGAGAASGAIDFSERTFFVVEHIAMTLNGERQVTFTVISGSFFLRKSGEKAGEGNRTLVCSLGSCRSAIELHPQGDFRFSIADLRFASSNHHCHEITSSS
jgi:hypothetical protein